MRKVRRSLVAVVAFVAIAVPSLAGAAGTTTIPTRNLTAKGGTVKWAATVHNAKTVSYTHLDVYKRQLLRRRPVDRLA